MMTGPSTAPGIVRASTLSAMRAALLLALLPGLLLTWQTFAASGAKALVPIHWDMFRLGKEPIGDAMRRLLAAAGANASQVVLRQIGATWALRLGSG
jgi:hypothetical protein